MWQLICRPKSHVLFAIVAALCLPPAAHAGMLNIIVSGLDLQYFNQAASNTGSIYDSISHTGGNLNTAEADSVPSVGFQLDTVDQGTVVAPPADPMFGDFKIDGVGNPLNNGFSTDIGNNGGGFGFDWFTAAGLSADYLRLGMTDIDVLVLSNVPAPGGFFFAGTATLLSQQLPFNLEFTSSTVAFSYTATQVMITPGAPNTATKVMALGALTITGEGRVVVPEPASALAACMAVGLIGIAWPRRRRAGTAT
jgi:hypothetical protein